MLSENPHGFAGVKYVEGLMLMRERTGLERRRVQIAAESQSSVILLDVPYVLNKLQLCPVRIKSRRSLL